MASNSFPIPKKPDPPSIKEKTNELQPLFAVLLKLNDAAMRKRIFDAINNVIPPQPQCARCANNQSSKDHTREKGTQTCHFFGLGHRIDQLSELLDKAKERSGTLRTVGIQTDQTTDDPNGSVSLLSHIKFVEGIKARRRDLRKRKNIIKHPHVLKTVVKEEREPEDNGVKVKIIQRNPVATPPVPSHVIVPRTSPSPVPCQLNSFCEEPSNGVNLDEMFPNLDDFELLGSLSNGPRPVFDQQLQEKINEMMTNEWNSCLTEISGFYPIHQAICTNDLKALKRQIVVLRYRKVNLNDIRTIEDDDSLLHIITKPDIKPEIIDEILNWKENGEGIDVKLQNLNGDTAVHSLIQSEVTDRNIWLLRRLLSQSSIDLLNIENENCETVLHTAIFANKSHYVQEILSFIDNELKIPVPKQLQIENNIETDLLTVYKKYLTDLTDIPERYPEKSDLIEQVDMKTGRTPLLIAINSLSEPIICMLMSHGSNPNIPDLNNITPVAMATDIIKNTDIVNLISLVAAFFNNPLTNQISKLNYSKVSRKTRRTMDDIDPINTKRIKIKEESF